MKKAIVLLSGGIEYLQPEWKSFHQIMPTLIQYIKLNPIWRLSLQTHKLMGIK